MTNGEIADKRMQMEDVHESAKKRIHITLI